MNNLLNIKQKQSDELAEKLRAFEAKGGVVQKVSVFESKENTRRYKKNGARVTQVMGDESDKPSYKYRESTL